MPSFPVALAILYMLLFGIAGLAHFALWAMLGEDERRMILQILDERAGVAVFILLLATAVLGKIFESIYRRYISIPARLGEQSTVMLDANRAMRLKPDGAPQVHQLTMTVNELADQRDALQRDVLARIEEAQYSIEAEKNRLAALMSELSQSVIVCNLNGRILLYNSRARQLFDTPPGGAQKGAGGLPIGLGRSIFAVIERDLINHALDKIQNQLGRHATQPIANFVIRFGGQLIRTQMAPVLGSLQVESLAEEHKTDRTAARSEPAINGFVLLLENITRTFEVESRRDAMLQSLTEGGRASLASAKAAVENLLAYPDMEVAQRDCFIGIVRDELDTMSRRLEQTVTHFSDALKVRWPLEEMRGSDLAHAARQNIEQQVSLPTKIEVLDDELWVKVDSFSLLQALTFLSARLKNEFNVREVHLQLTRAGRLACLDLLWAGNTIGTETLTTWELEPMRAHGEDNALTLREVVERHGGELWFERDKVRHRSFARILLPAAVAHESFAPATHRIASRPEFYDFDLFRQTAESRALEDRQLSQLIYTVFDSETTGLEPSSGDEIIQIGAIRIVNGRLLRSETYEQLINPHRPVAAASVRIHGITDEMLRDQPSIGQVLPAFHAFCEDTVLVAHNAAFDMRFLQLKEQSTGVAFQQPVLDTLLLSSVIHPHQESHKLEAIAERLGVNVIGRHTALGDAIVTGEVFLKMIPLLAEQGIRTLREAREASERTFHAKVKY